jgi:hypothetical protein
MGEPFGPLTEDPAVPPGTAIANTGTDTEDVPEPAVLFESPEYDPVIVALPALLGATKVTEQLPDPRAQVEDGAKEPAVAANDTVPVGDAPVTVAVQSTGRPGATTEGQATDTDEEFGGAVTAIVAAAEFVVAPEPSVTRSSNDQVPTVVRAPVEVVGRSPMLQLKEAPKLTYPSRGASTSHWQV